MCCAQLLYEIWVPMATFYRPEYTVYGSSLEIKFFLKKFSFSEVYIFKF